MLTNKKIKTQFQFQLKSILFLMILISFNSNKIWAITADVETGVKRSEKLVSLLRMANLKGDINLSQSYASDLENHIEKMGEKILPLICDFNCHYELARYYNSLMLSSLYLPEVSAIKSTLSAFDPARSEGYADKASEIVERGLKYLNGNAVTQGSSDNNSNTNESNKSLRDLTYKLVRLQAIKIESYMTIGDIWYQTVSQHEIKKLDFAISRRLNDFSSTNDLNWRRAKTYYDSAQMTVIDALTDIPDDGSYDDLRAGVVKFKDQLQQRLKSLESGKLFLNLDPDDFTALDYESLERMFDNDVRRLQSVEKDISDASRIWFNSKTSSNLKGLDEDRYQKNESINLVMHTVGKMESLAQVQLMDLEKLRIGNQKSVSDLETKKQIYSLEMELAKKMSEFTYKQKTLEAKTESDLLHFDQDSHADGRNEIRWMMNWNLSKLNLNLQVHSFDSQKQEYDRQQALNEEKLDEIDLSLAQKKEAKQINLKKLEEIDGKINIFKAQQTEIFDAKRKMIKNDICRIENDLHFIGSYNKIRSPSAGMRGEACEIVKNIAITEEELFQKMCGQNGLKNKMAGLKVSTLEEIHNRVSKDEWKLIENLAKLKDAELNRQISVNNDLSAKINEAISGIRTEAKEENSVTLINQGLIQGAATAYALSCAVPSTTLHVQGFSSGFSTNIDPSKSGYAAYIAVKSIGEITSQLLKIKNNENRNIISEQEKIIEVQGHLGAIKNQLVQEKARLESEKHYFQIKDINLRNDFELSRIENSITSFECDRQGDSLKQRVASLVEEHDRLITQFKLEEKQNDLIGFEVDQAESQKNQVALENNIIDLDIKKLNRQGAHIVKDEGIVRDLKASYEERKRLVLENINELSQMASESLAETEKIKMMLEKQKNYVIGLSEEEKKYVANMANNETTEVSKLISFLTEEDHFKKLDLGLQNKISDFRIDLQNKIKDQHEKIDGFYNKRDTFNGSAIGTSENLKQSILMSENEMMSYFRGVPDFIDSKKMIIEDANRIFGLMQSKRNVISDLVMNSTAQKPIFFRTATDFIDAKSSLDNNWIASNKEKVITSYFTFHLPYSSFAYQSLLTKGHLYFEISKDWSNLEKMGIKINGDKNIMDKSSLKLVDIVPAALMNDDAKLSSHKLSVKHFGDGVFFENRRGEQVPILFSSKSRTLRDIAIIDSKGHSVENTRDYWNTVIYPCVLESKNAGPANNTHKIFELLGKPLLAKYEISTDSIDGLNESGLELTFIYSNR